MNILIKAICLVFFITACTSEINNESAEIKHKWQLLKVLYDDGSAKLLENGNYILIEKNSIYENIKQYGSRHYPYYRNNNILYLTSGETSVECYLKELLFLP